MLAPFAAVAKGKFKCTLNSLFGSSYKRYNSTLTIALHCICPNLKLALILDKLPMRICADLAYFCVFVGFKGLFTYYVSQNQGFLEPPPLRRQWSAFGLPPIPPRQILSAFA